MATTLAQLRKKAPLPSRPADGIQPDPGPNRRQRRSGLVRTTKMEVPPGMADMMQQDMTVQQLRQRLELDTWYRSLTPEDKALIKSSPQVKLEKAVEGCGRIGLQASQSALIERYLELRIDADQEATALEAALGTEVTASLKVPEGAEPQTLTGTLAKREDGQYCLIVSVPNDDGGFDTDNVLIDSVNWIDMNE